MIELKNVCKRFENGECVLKNINLSFPRYGIVVIYGPSGCGKTTLLNVISSLCDFEGEISFNGKKYSKMSNGEKDILRNTKIGFIFQDYKLFEFETVKNNLMLALDLKTSDKKSKKERRVIDLLNVIGLSSKANELVSKLSGGEKQRVAIARAICNSPSLVLADEPTGNLDTSNSEAVMKIMERISKNSLVIMVSHDEKLTKKYADQIIYMKDGVIEKSEYNNHNDHADILPLIHLNGRDNKATLPLGFCIRHSFNNIKRRKWRTAFVFLTSSLGLVSVGLGTVLSDIISTNLYKSYSSIIDANKVIISPKEKSESKRELRALSYNEVDELAHLYSDSVEDVGIYYWNDFDKMFTSSNFGFDNGVKESTLPNFHLKNINEYIDLKDVKDLIYPKQITAVDNNQVVLGLTYQTLNEICFQLSIKRTVDSLSSYLKEKELNLDIYASNNSWSYDIGFSINVVGFTMINKNVLIHSNPQWNEYIFEEKMHLSSTDLLNTTSKNPWDLKKSYYLEFKRNRDVFLTDIKFSKTYKDVVAEVLNDEHYRTQMNNMDYELCRRVALLSRQNNQGVNGFYNTYIKNSSKNIKRIIYGNKNAYAIYPDNLMMGFAKTTYLSNDLPYIEDAIDLTAYIRYEESMNVSVPESVIEGHFAKSNMQGLTFNPSYKLVEGREPDNYGEIVVSRAIVERLKIVSPLNKTIYIAFPAKEELLPNGYLSRDYHVTSIKIVGISESNRIEISHREEWSIMFFQTNLGISNLDLDIETVAAEIDENKEEQVMNQLSRAFPRFEVSSPISNVKDSIQKVCGYIEKILLILSISSVVISSLLLSICNYLHFIEIKKDIGLVRCLGIDKNEASKFVFVHSIMLGMISAIISTVQLLVVCYFLSKSLSTMFDISSTFIFNGLALLYMFGLALVVSIVSSLIIKKKVNKLDPLECLRS
ncbi:MAG: ABC transporter ATP-binding protein/permease [Bacilli bacterium]|nr:ABC transporter ATP-binding protein/permease [Bacilli bacterium]